MVRSDVPQRLKDKVRRSYARMIETDDFSIVKSDFVKITVFDVQLSVGSLLR